jgi:hypothetical protein
VAAAGGRAVGLGGSGAGGGAGTTGTGGGVASNSDGSADTGPDQGGLTTRAFLITGAFVRSIVIDNGVVYVGGRFGSSPNQPFPGGIGAVDETTLSNRADWLPQVNPLVNALAVSGGVVYAGLDGGNGDLVALDAVTGAPRLSLPNGSSAVTTLAVGAGTLYLGGIFQVMAGAPRAQFAAIDATTGALKSWAPNDTFFPNGWPLALAVGGSTVYAGGTFTLSNGGNGTRQYLAAIDATTGALTPWNPAPDGAINALAISGDDLYVGGSFSTIAGQTRNKVAAFDLTTGSLLPWAPEVASADGGPSSVASIAVRGDVVYLGGKFSRVAGQPRAGLAAVDATFAAVLPWVPMTSLSNSDVSATVTALAASDEVVAAGIAGSTVGLGIAFYPPASP